MTAAIAPTAQGLVVRGLTTAGAYGSSRPALDLTVAAGERVALVGASRTSTAELLAAVAGRRPVTGGDRWLDGQSLSTAAALALVAHVRSDHRLVGTLTAAENLVTVLLAHGIRSGPGLWRRAEHQLAALGLPAASWHNLVEQLSGGQQQRVALARGLVGRPRLLVLEDPTSELDPDSTDLVIEVLDRAAAHGLCCVLTTFDEALLRSCTRQIPV